MSFKVSSPDVAQQTQISFESNHVHLSYNDIVISLELSNEINPTESTSTATTKKVELKLKKVTEGANWLKVEKDGEAKLLATGVVQQGPTPSYPTSSKNKKNWDQLDKQITKEIATEKPEGDAALNSLFKQIYERADENTRRAMIKSY